jgi:hypothetical protein
LRNPLGADKAGDFNHRETGIGETFDQFNLGFGRNELLFILETITRSYFDNLDIIVLNRSGEQANLQKKYESDE